MTDVVTDTHGLIWYLEDSLRLSAAARDAFDRCDRGEMLIYVPTICLVEIVYLQEKGWIPLELMAKLNAELQAGGSGLSLCDLTPDIASAVARVPRASVPDMPDRIIADFGYDGGIVRFEVLHASQVVEKTTEIQFAVAA